MPTQFQFRRGTTSQHNSFTGAIGEVTVDTDKDTARVHDGSVSGGREIARSNFNNVSDPQFGGTSSLKLPSGTTAQRSGSPTNGDIRYNASSGFVEVYQQGAWSVNDIMAKATMLEFGTQVTLSNATAGTCISGTYTKTYGTETNLMIWVNGWGRGNASGQSGMYFEIGGIRSYEFFDYQYDTYANMNISCYGVGLFTGLSSGSKSLVLGWAGNNSTVQRPAAYWNANAGTNEARAREGGSNILIMEVKAV